MYCGNTPQPFLSRISKLLPVITTGWSRKEDEVRFGAILVNYRQTEEIPSVLSAGRLQMRHKKSGAPTYWPAAELSGAQFEIASGAQFENVVGPNGV
ncbi:hypothetical protein E2C01_079450 [Portunus trituberculatus]|uniref:Uncharacterized protein n=1 Tax=Portunus trituberculatus TaxID=210409 RepID=A0A5B7IQN1_PORTR|nr:hypothetical protein [Portunus trituberculatus]